MTFLHVYHDISHTCLVPLKTIAMCAGIGAPGTLREILRGYFGDKKALEKLKAKRDERRNNSLNSDAKALQTPDAAGE